METKLERIADKSRNEKRPIFTSLYHLINVVLEQIYRHKILECSHYVHNIEYQKIYNESMKFINKLQ